MDPPYAKQKVLAQLAEFINGDLLAPGATVLVETGTDVDYPETIPGYQIVRHQTYSVAQVMILRKED
jgi:16S rRNA G966 N2-methylase RsmD